MCEERRLRFRNAFLLGEAGAAPTLGFHYVGHLPPSSAPATKTPGGQMSNEPHRQKGLSRVGTRRGSLGLRVGIMCTRPRMVNVSPTPWGMSQSQAYPVVPLMQPQALERKIKLSLFTDDTILYIR